MTKVIYIIPFLLSGILPATAQTFEEWHDNNVNEINRLPMRASFFPFKTQKGALRNNPQEEENYVSLNGDWKFNWVENADQRHLDFFELEFNDKGWDEIQVPGLWELNGYGDPLYVNIGYAW